MSRIQTVWSHFSGLVHRQFGCYVALNHFLDPKKLPKKDILDTVIKHKKAKFIFVQDDLIFPITKNHFDGGHFDSNHSEDAHLYGYISVFKGISLLPNQIEKIQMLIDLLVRSVVLAEHKKQVTSNIENFLNQQIKLMKKQSQEKIKKPSIPVTRSHQGKIFSLSNAVSIDPRYPVFILAHNKKVAIKEAYNIHVQSQLLQFLHIDQVNQDQLLYPEFISYLGHLTVYIPEITSLPLVIQKSLEKYFRCFYQHAKFRCPRIVAATTKPIYKLNEIQNLIDQKIIYKPLLCYLVRSRVLHTSHDMFHTGVPHTSVPHTEVFPHHNVSQDKFYNKDIQNFIHYLFHTENTMDNVVFMKSNKKVLQPS